jgi:hypothetical protein
MKRLAVTAATFFIWENDWSSNQFKLALRQ